MEWYEIKNAGVLDSPAILLYPQRIRENIRRCIALVKDRSLLRPHIKTSKITEVCQLMLDAGITKFKCATIAEAEMLGLLHAPDVLLAYQPVGPKIDRFIRLIKIYPTTKFSCLVDSETTAQTLSAKALQDGVTINVFIDLNVGMNRSGIRPGSAVPLFSTISALPRLQFEGLHAYDGQLHDMDPQVNRSKALAGFEQVKTSSEEIRLAGQTSFSIVAGGSVTFPVYREMDLESSPGTFVFWDWSYKHLLPDEPFDYAALVLTRVVSVVSDELICIDLGHKSVASESPLPRVHFLNAPDAVPVSHSEEHMVLKVPAGGGYRVGDLLYGVPVHICPTISMYEEVSVVNNHQVEGQWKVTARDKKIIT